VSPIRPRLGVVIIVLVALLAIAAARTPLEPRAGSASPAPATVRER
jgi:hypothetical protein